MHERIMGNSELKALYNGTNEEARAIVGDKLWFIFSCISNNQLKIFTILYIPPYIYSHSLLLLILMQEGGVPFRESFYLPYSASTQAEETEEYCPWSNEVQDYKKQPLYKRKKRAGQSHRRYTSQLDQTKNNSEELPQRSALPCHEVTLVYETRKKRFTESSESKKGHFKLPALSSKRRSLELRRSVEVAKDEQWGVLGESKKGSLKRYTSRWPSDEPPPQF